MHWSRTLIPTLRENPADAQVASHRLMVRAGLIRQLARGIYTYLPLGLRVIRKIERIVRDEMNAAGALEVLLPTVQPAELWKETGRWQVYGKELLRLSDRSGSEFCYAPTAEEVITDLVRHEVRSYRDLPLNLYQIQTKFRDEVRPRFGLMRGREFAMKDAYSFDVDDAAAGLSYQRMFDAYQRIFTRCGLTFRAVEADTGSIGGSDSHEFAVLADSGEDEVVVCSSCHYAANVERADVPTPPPVADPVPPAAAPEEVETPGRKTVEDVTAFLGVGAERLLKTLIVVADGRLLAALLRGDHELNEAALRRALGAAELELASDAQVLEATGAPVGFAGPVGLGLEVVADEALRGRTGLVCGGNRSDLHLVGVEPGRDFQVGRWASIRRITAADPCPRCGGAVEIRRGIEVGHVFRLGTKYSAAMGATFLDDAGQSRTAVMGCYGIGIGRTAAAAIEQNHDERGICWPVPIAPFEVVVIGLGSAPEVVAAACRVHDELEGRGIEVLLDDRDERAGVKFNDAELIGFPFAVVIGGRGLAQGTVEVRTRTGGEAGSVALEEVVEHVAARVVAART